MGITLLLAGCGRSEPTPVAVAQPAPTFTATPVGELVVAAAILTVTVPVVPTPTLTPIPTATPLPAQWLAEGMQLHGYGNYGAARTAFAAVLAAPETQPGQGLQARYALARAYLADDAYSEALLTVDQLDATLATSATLSNTIQSKQHFLRAQALNGLGRYSDAIAAYWRFLEAYPWMAEPVQQNIAAAYLALGDNASASIAYRRAADATGDVV
ncbi:MAG: hypothetical protein M3Q45_06165, partial [Chloroflexota bacterium]|nr:hypothetical protein [Chloroflexota bacterium]